MRLLRPRTLIAAATFGKPTRRCSLLTPNLDISLRFTSIFVIAVAFCEFSGLAQVVADAYTSTNLRLSTTSPSPPPPFSVRNPLSPHADYYTAMVADRHHKRAILNNLYRGLKSDATVERSMKTRRPDTNPPHNPTFLFEMHWSEDNLYDKVCRIHNACMLKDGTLLVHPKLHRLKRKLIQCGISRIGYLPHNRFPSNSSHSNVDLFGLKPSRYHIPHFLTDILPMIYAAELLRPTTAHSMARSHCETLGGDACPRSAMGGKLKPAIFVDDRVRHMTVSSWVPQLSAMLAGHPYLMFPSTMFSDGEPACFRSVVAFNQHSYIRHGSEWFGEENRMFASHGLTRASISRRPPDVVSPTRGAHPTCHIRVAILNRVGWIRRSGMLLGRDLTNVEEVRKHLSMTAKGIRGMTISSEVYFFENKTFVDQVDVLQQADVVLGVHGAGLGNLLFARKDTAVLEVLPFTYYAGPFQSVAEALYLRYGFVVAEPDTGNFMECIEQRARRVGNQGVIAKSKELWDEALKRRKETGELGFLKTHKFTDPFLAQMKMCARTQRMKVDAMVTARKLVQMAKEVCGLAVVPKNGQDVDMVF